MSETPGWIAAAASMPVAFAQVREDPLLDLWVLDQIAKRKRVALVASGGCTAAAIAARPDIELVHIVDPNPAQIALARLKLHLLETTEPRERLRVLGHGRLSLEARLAKLTQLLEHLALPSNIFGPPEHVAGHGPDHSGRYELLFAALRRELAVHAQALEQVLDMSEPGDQALKVAPTAPLGRALNVAFEKIMSHSNLVALFGEGATRNPRKSFSAHFAEQLRLILGRLPAAGNPFLSQMLLGRFSSRAEHHWLQLPASKLTAAIRWEDSLMIPALKQHQGEFDFVHLSNILDWLGPDDARATLDSAWSALRPGGWVIVRQLNSALDIPSLCPRFTWDRDAGMELLSRDRSFFYRTICVGTRK